MASRYSLLRRSMSCPPSPSHTKTFCAASTCQCSRPSFPVGGTGTRYQPSSPDFGVMSSHPLESDSSALGVGAESAPLTQESAPRNISAEIKANDANVERNKSEGRVKFNMPEAKR